MLDRILYFAMLPTGVLKDSPSIAYILLGEVCQPICDALDLF